MKNVIAIVVGLALLVVLGSFAALGFGSGVLSVGGTNGTTPQTQIFNDTTSTAGALEWNLHVTTQQGYPIISSLIPGGVSTLLSFGLSLSSNNNCGGGAGPVWDGGGNDYAYWIVQLIGPGGSVQHFNASVNGQSVQGYYYVISMNGTASSHSNLAYCEQNPNTAGNYQSPNLNNEEFWSQNVAFVGVYPTSTIRVDFNSINSFCHNQPPAVGNSNGGDCAQAAARNSNCATGSAGYWCGGSFSSSKTINAYFTTVMPSGSASFHILNPGQIVYNGGVLQVSVTTGFDGPGQYQLELITPSVRTGGGTIDTTFQGNPATVANNCNGCLVTWNVPSNAASNSSVGVAYNTWQIVLVASYINAQTSPLSIAINPIYSPAKPIVSYTTGSGAEYPLPGDTITFSIQANPPSANGSGVNQITVWVFYLTPGNAADQLPPCGNQWISSGCPNGQVLNVTINGRSASGTFETTVTPPTGTNQIAIEAQSGSTKSQPSPIASFVVSITPPGCQVGQPCDPFHTNLSTWTSVGPILLVVALFLAGLLVAVVVPMRKWMIFVVVVGVGIVAIILFPAISHLFLPGGPFGGPTN